MKKRKRETRSRGSRNALPLAWGESAAKRMGAELRPNSIPEGKMSDVVADYAGPLLDAFAATDEEAIEVLRFVCLLWNLSLSKRVNPKLFRDTEPDLVNLLGRAPFFLSPDGAMNIIDTMVSHWESYFSWCQRLIVDKNIEISRTGPHLSIVSMPIPDEEASNTETT